MKVLITGGRGGLGLAFAAALGEAEVTALDLPEFDVGDPAAWRALDGSYDAAFLNAGVLTGADRHGCAHRRAVQARAAARTSTASSSACASWRRG